MGCSLCKVTTRYTHLRTSPVWPTNFLVVKPVFKSHSLRVLSHEDERANCPSDEMAMSETKWLWPWRIFLGKPNDESSRVNCQTMMVLSGGHQYVFQAQVHFTTRSLADKAGALLLARSLTHPARQSRSCPGSRTRSRRR